MTRAQRNMWTGIVVVVGGLLLIPATARAQTSTSGSIAGVVRDTSGAVMPGVTVDAPAAYQAAASSEPAPQSGGSARGSNWGAVSEPKRPLLRPYPYMVDFPYEVVENHFKPPFPEDWTWRSVDGIYAESPNRVLVYNSGILPKLDGAGANGWPRSWEDGRQGKLGRPGYVAVWFDGNGNFVEEWKELDTLTDSAHQVKVDPSDPEKHIWLVNQCDDTGNEFCVLKYTRDGEQVMTVSSDKDTGCPNAQDVSFTTNGDFWCLSSDNAGKVVYGIHKFTKDGKRVPGSTFGNKAGKGNGEFIRAHAILVDRKNRIFVSDRSNYRVQVFDQSGKHLENWPNIVARSFGMDQYDRLWVICAEDNCGKDLAPHSISVHDMNNHGKVLFNWGVAGAEPGQMYFSGQMDSDSENNLYIGELGGGRVQKWKPRRGANPAHLVPPLIR